MVLQGQSEEAKTQKQNWVLNSYPMILRPLEHKPNTNTIILTNEYKGLTHGFGLQRTQRLMTIPVLMCSIY